MAKVATQHAPVSLTTSSLQIGLAARNIVAPMTKRKTPSELRGEQLKRTNDVEITDESPAPLSGLFKITSDNGPKKPDLPRNPRYIETRMDELYPAKKSRLRVLSLKDNAKENISTEQNYNKKSVTVLSSLATMKQISCSENSAALPEVSEKSKVEAHQTIERCNQSIFRSVGELSSNGEKSSGLAVVDMDKALKGLVAHEIPANSGLAAETSLEFGDHTLRSATFLSECVLPGQKVPLDFTLKTKMLVSSSCTVNWIHRSIMSSTYIGLPHLTAASGCPKDCSSSGQTSTSQPLHSNALQSWVYPQSTLPPSVISVLSSQAADGDFLRKRQQGWDDSFRSLYYMLRKNMCSSFYVCTSHFIVMFICSSASGVTKKSYNAYISQSTRGLRSLLKEHDVCFSMPLCHSQVEQPTTEDLVELSEIEKHSLGQTRRLTSLFDVDSTPQSLLQFCGNRNVHALYDFLLNYRSSLTFLSGVDVPVLYSPVPFQNGALSAPEIRCVESKRADNAAYSGDSTAKDGESFSLRSSIEITDTYIPTWIISRICTLLGSEGKSFEASFITERTSIGLNVALKKFTNKIDSKDLSSKDLQEFSSSSGFPEALITPCLDSGFLKGLKYCNSSYTASLSPL
ncbi:Protein downstream neighbor of Son [Euphorbia peplus]|nr:Protein downstream neighbor of Son [Euphorbia peplus]